MDRGDAKVLIAHGTLVVPGAGNTPLEDGAFGTLLSNLAYYGYALNAEGVAALRAIAAVDAEAWWAAVEPALRELSGDDKNMAEHVVYKNFPAETLSMSEGEYWIRQLLMYWGVPNELMREPEVARLPAELPPPKVLQLGTDESLGKIFISLAQQPARWSEDQLAHVRHLAPRFHRLVDPLDVPFVENRVWLWARLFETQTPLAISTASDVLRLAVALSDGDVTLRSRARFRRFTRRERRALLALLENASGLEEDIARRKERFKRLFRELRPGDYSDRYPKVVSAYDRLYRGASFQTFASSLERGLLARDPAALGQLSERPGEFMRRLVHALRVYGSDAAGAFAQVMPELSNLQLLRLRGVLRAHTKRRHRLFPPRGNWSRVQRVEAGEALSESLVNGLVDAIEQCVRRRVQKHVPAVQLDARCAWVRLATNDGELSPYGRGTRFPIPAEVDFLRSATYWSSGKTTNNIWYDNGWNFFDEEWTPKGSCCWNAPKFGGAAFSGDPTNSKDAEGRACQLIDLYPAQLRASGVRYAVWNVLAYSRVSFEDAKEVFAALQWGTDAQSGKLFEPARAQLAFPLTRAALTKYVAYVDLEARELVYMDADLPGRVMSAKENEGSLSELMPAFDEYLDSLPSVHDLFQGLPESPEGVHVAYDDEAISLDGQGAYVFRPVNPANRFEALDLNALLELRS